MFRNIYLKNPSSISLNHYQLAITTNGECYHFPFDDTQSLLLESLETTISTSALSALASHGVTVITCDSEHLPVATLLPLQGYYQHLKTLNIQFNLQKRFRDRVTKRIIKQKITNQYQVAFQLTGTSNATLKKLATEVKDGDKGFRESVAAKIYFNEIGGKKFSRRTNILTNGALNYGYAILRSCIARELLLFGFEPALAFNHHNANNPFNLADDLIEPFRPLVDLYVFTNLATTNEPILTSTMRAHLLNLLSYEVLIEGTYHTAQHAIHLVVESLLNACTTQKTKALILPSIVSLKVHDNGE